MPVRPKRFKPHKQATAKHEAPDTRVSSSARGYDYKWQQARKRYLTIHPLCVWCAKEWRVTPAKVVDHIIPHRNDERLFWSIDNWQSLCKTCHDSRKQRLEKSGKETRIIGVDGLPMA
jgi:5-methylcytosine-specific restriction endonuclease McrA